MGDQTLSYTDIFWIQYSCPYVLLFFFLSTGYILKSNPLFQALQSAQVLSLTLLLQVILPTLSSSGYLITISLLSEYFSVFFLIYIQFHLGPFFLLR